MRKDKTPPSRYDRLITSLEKDGKPGSDRLATELAVLDAVGVYIPYTLIAIALKSPGDPLGELMALRRAGRLLNASPDGTHYSAKNPANYARYTRHRAWARWLFWRWEIAHQLLSVANAERRVASASVLHLASTRPKTD